MKGERLAMWYERHMGQGIIFLEIAAITSIWRDLSGATPGEEGGAVRPARVRMTKQEAC